jgi:hypothetical protein
MPVDEYIPAGGKGIGPDYFSSLPALYIILKFREYLLFRKKRIDFRDCQLNIFQLFFNFQIHIPML